MLIVKKMIVTTTMLKRVIPQIIGLLFLFLGLQACDGGPETKQQDDPRAQVQITYTGPVASNGDVQSFKRELWDKLSPNNRCGSCHSQGQKPQFVNNDNINDAYDAAMSRNNHGTPYINLTAPNESLLVTKVEDGHHCWEVNHQVCADTIALYIQRWAGDRAGGNSKTIELEAPVDRMPGESRHFPTNATLFAATVHPLLTNYCADCHTETAATAQAPFFADSDPDVAYPFSKSKINLDTPQHSRFVARLTETHRCWDDCNHNAEEMQQAITAMANAITPTTVDLSRVVASRALSLPEGIVANSGGRFESNIIALYEFKTGEGTTAYDSSGIDPLLHLTLTGDVEWVGGWGIKINNGKAQGATTNSAKLNDLITATGEYSLEAWITPGNVTQEDRRIISYSAGTTNRNFSLHQTLYNYNFLHRSGTTSANGEPALSTSDNDEVLQAALQHVVATVSPEGRKLYINGELITDDDPVDAGSLRDWNNSYAFVLGNEVSNDRLWQGTFRMVAIHNRALTSAQVLQNFDVGVGEKFYLLFGISEHIDIPNSYIVFEVSQFDNHSYLFNEPFFISLSDTTSLGSVNIQKLRIGINGKESAIGQSYTNINVTLDDALYAAEGKQVLSTLGTIIPLEKGPETDEFFLTFEILGEKRYAFVETEPTTPAAPADASVLPASIGLRTFDEINASMSSVTGVDANHPSINITYQTIKQQLPTTENINGFLASQQVAIAQLAIEYCHQLLNTPSLRDSFFGTDVDFNNAESDQAFDTEFKRTLITDPLLNNIMGKNLSTQPDKESIRTELNQLINKLDECSNCTASERIERTHNIVKGACAATLGSAVLLVQ
jgi:hypothetical protein